MHARIMNTVHAIADKFDASRLRVLNLNQLVLFSKLCWFWSRKFGGSLTFSDQHEKKASTRSFDSIRAQSSNNRHDILSQISVVQYQCEPNFLPEPDKHHRVRVHIAYTLYLSFSFTRDWLFDKKFSIIVPKRCSDASADNRAIEKPPISSCSKR